MKVITFQPEKYRECNIYYRNMRDHFEYLIVIGGEIYASHITVKPTILNKLLNSLHIEKTQYSQQQQNAIIKQLRNLAQTTIDFVLDKK